jgi:F1F0 ATPase subunit 2
MKEVSFIFLVFGAGIVLGIFFFGGLWWTTRRALHSKHPALWFIGSLFVRVSITMAGFYYVTNQKFEFIMVCLLGFILARALITKYTQIPELKHNQE